METAILEDDLDQQEEIKPTPEARAAAKDPADAEPPSSDRHRGDRLVSAGAFLHFLFRARIFSAPHASMALEPIARSPSCAVMT